jgi:putative ABC transport system permease protein
VLLVACANVANLFLIRSEVRRRETARRRALGAGNRAIVCYFLTESALLSIGGGAIGLALAWGAVHLLVAFGPASLPRLQKVRLDGVVLAFTLVVTLLTASALGSIPLLRFTPLGESLHDGVRGHTASRGRYRARHLLMGGQIAEALVLLASALMLRSFQKLRAVDPGFDPTSRLTFRIGLPRSDYPDPGRMAAHLCPPHDGRPSLGASRCDRRICLDVSAAFGAAALPGRSAVRRRPPSPPGAIAPFIAIRALAGGYFETMGMRVLRGRGIDRGDVEREEPVVMLNKALVDISFPNQDPIGQRVRLGNPSLASGAPEWLTIAGVVSNTPTFGLAEATPFP